MDRDGAHRANEAAEHLVEATWDTYKTLVDHTLGLQQRNARFVREMVDDSIEELRRQARGIPGGGRGIGPQRLHRLPLRAFYPFLLLPGKNAPGEAGEWGQRQAAVRRLR